jgi:hypothetical protein
MIDWLAGEATPEIMLENNSLVYVLNESGYSLEDSIAISEDMIAKNPYMVLHAVPCIESDFFDPMNDPLIDAFSWAYEATNGNIELLAEALVYDDCVHVVAEELGDASVSHAASTAASGIKASASSAAEKVGDAAGTATRGVRRFANDVKHKVVNPLAVRLHNMVKAITDANEEEKREMVISGSFFHKLRHLFKKFLLFWWVRPAIFALLPFSPITILVKIVVTTGMAVDLVHKGYKATVGDGNLVPETRNRVIQELELELRMTREKIEDARGAGDREKKYQLMRLENKIEQEIARVKYGASI